MRHRGIEASRGVAVRSNLTKLLYMLFGKKIGGSKHHPKHAVTRKIGGGTSRIFLKTDYDTPRTHTLLSVHTSQFGWNT